MSDLTDKMVADPTHQEDPMTPLIRRAREIAYRAREEKQIRWPDVQVLVDAVLAVRDDELAAARCERDEARQCGRMTWLLGLRAWTATMDDPDLAQHLRSCREDTP